MNINEILKESLALNVYNLICKYNYGKNVFCFEMLDRGNFTSDFYELIMKGI